MFEDLVIKFFFEFLKKVYKFEKSFEFFVFVVGKINIVFNIDVLVFILWFCVFDFDMYSRENGFMFVFEGYNKIIYLCILRDCF